MLKTMLYPLPMVAITVGIEYHFAYKTLGIRKAKVFAFCVMLVVNFMASWLNVKFHFAESIGENNLYYGTITFLLYMLIFEGSIVKKLFFTVFIRCGIPITFYVLLPIVSYMFGKTSKDYLLALQIVGYVNTLLSIALMEYAIRKFQNLRRELPTGYTIYLTAVLLFVQVAVYAGYEGMFVRNTGIISLPAALTASVFALVGIGIVMVAVFAVDRQVDISVREQLHVMQTENFKSRELEWCRISSFRHDIKNHLLCLNTLLENGKTEQAASYMRNLADTVKQLDSPVQTGNDYADALLSVKYTEARRANIKISLDMAIPAQGYIQPIDLCCILSNAFDNAIAACKQMKEGERWIGARAFVKQSQFVIEIKNSKPAYVTVIDGEVSPKKMTTDHGLGLKNVKTVVEQYGGTFDLSADEAFSFSVLLPPNFDR